MKNDKVKFTLINMLQEGITKQDIFSGIKKEDLMQEEVY